MKQLREWLKWHSVQAHIVAPIWLRIPEKRRWQIVDRLNRSQRRCWVALVDDALAYREDDPCDIKTPSIRPDGAERCRAACEWMHDHAEGGCGCYCGKFQFPASERAS